MESEDERMVVTVAGELTPLDLLQRLNAELPEGLSIRTCSAEITEPAKCGTYRVSFAETFSEPLASFLTHVDYERELLVSSPKGKLKKIVLRDILIDIRIVDATRLELSLICEPGKTVRPGEVLKQGFGFSQEALADALIRKLKASPTGCPQKGAVSGSTIKD